VHPLGTHLKEKGQKGGFPKLKGMENRSLVALQEIERVGTVYGKPNDHFSGFASLKSYSSFFRPIFFTKTGCMLLSRICQSTANDQADRIPECPGEALTHSSLKKMRIHDETAGSRILSHNVRGSARRIATVLPFIQNLAHT
jgi:hypothetical protein